MNLIEQLGGYERAKDGLHRLKLEKKDLLTCGDLVVVESEIDAALIEYRRQHKIFEIGDEVVLLGDGTWGHLFEVEKMSPKGRKPTKLKTNVFGNFHVGHNIMRHATPEEIKAGRRL